MFNFVAHAAGNMSYTNKKDKINGYVWKIQQSMHNIVQMHCISLFPKYVNS